MQSGTVILHVKPSKQTREKPSVLSPTVTGSTSPESKNLQTFSDSDTSSPIDSRVIEKERSLDASPDIDFKLSQEGVFGLTSPFGMLSPDQDREIQPFLSLASPPKLNNLMSPSPLENSKNPLQLEEQYFPSLDQKPMSLTSSREIKQAQRTDDSVHININAEDKADHSLPITRKETLAMGYQSCRTALTGPASVILGGYWMLTSGIGTSGAAFGVTAALSTPVFCTTVASASAVGVAYAGYCYYKESEKIKRTNKEIKQIIAEISKVDKELSDKDDKIDLLTQEIKKYASEENELKNSPSSELTEIDEEEKEHTSKACQVGQFLYSTAGMLAGSTWTVSAVGASFSSKFALNSSLFGIAQLAVAFTETLVSTGVNHYQEKYGSGERVKRRDYLKKELEQKQIQLNQKNERLIKLYQQKQELSQIKLREMEKELNSTKKLLTTTIEKSSNDQSHVTMASERSNQLEQKSEQQESSCPVLKNRTLQRSQSFTSFFRPSVATNGSALNFSNTPTSVNSSSSLRSRETSS